jgi:hypothetical protein
MLTAGEFDARRLMPSRARPAVPVPEAAAYASAARRVL